MRPRTYKLSTRGDFDRAYKVIIDIAADADAATEACAAYSDAAAQVCTHDPKDHAAAVKAYVAAVKALARARPTRRPFYL
jgi:methylthioribose-1-phosphate isomerase